MPTLQEQLAPLLPQVIIAHHAGWYVGRFEGFPNKVMGSTPQEVESRLQQTPWIKHHHRSRTKEKV